MCLVNYMSSGYVRLSVNGMLGLWIDSSLNVWLVCCFVLSGM